MKRKWAWTAMVAVFVVAVLVPEHAVAEPQWWSEVQEGDGELMLVLTVRGAACGKVGSVVRTGADGQQVPLFTSTDEVFLDTEDAQLDCGCEPIGTEFGTGSKSCPERTCGKDDQCICTKRCVPVKDPCPPVGALTYAVADRDGEPLLEVAHQLAAPASGCKDEPLLTIDEEEEGDSGGCSAATTSSGAAGMFAWLVAILLALTCLGPRRRLFLLAVGASLALTAGAGCSGKEKEKEEKKNKKGENEGAGLKPIDVDFEGTPWESVVTLQTELLDIFEVGSVEKDVLREARRFRDRQGERFAGHCRKALAFYAEMPEKRMGYVAKAGRVWQEVEKRVRQVTADWGPGNMREAKIVVNSFECR